MAPNKFSNREKEKKKSPLFAVESYMNFKLKYGLPFTNIVLTHKGRSLSSDNFLVDTGSASTGHVLYFL